MRVWHSGAFGSAELGGKARFCPLLAVLPAAAARRDRNRARAVTCRCPPSDGALCLNHCRRHLQSRREMWRAGVCAGSRIRCLLPQCVGSQNAILTCCITAARMCHGNGITSYWKKGDPVSRSCAGAHRRVVLP